MYGCDPYCGPGPRYRSYSHGGPRYYQGDRYSKAHYRYMKQQERRYRSRSYRNYDRYDRYDPYFDDCWGGPHGGYHGGPGYVPYAAPYHHGSHLHGSHLHGMHGHAAALPLSTCADPCLSANTCGAAPVLASGCGTAFNPYTSAYTGGCAPAATCAAPVLGSGCATAAVDPCYGGAAALPACTNAALPGAVHQPMM